MSTRVGTCLYLQGENMQTMPPAVREWHAHRCRPFFSLFTHLNTMASKKVNEKMFQYMRRVVAEPHLVRAPFG